MPVYKRSNVIELSFNSILKQTYKPLELIIIDNNTDVKETKILKDIINSYRKKFLHPVRYVKSLKNSGSQARNIGAKMSKGDFVAFLDSDVVLDKDYYEILLNYFSVNEKLIAIQGLDRSLLLDSKANNRFKLVDKLIYLFEDFFETSSLFNRSNGYVSPSLAVAHPNVQIDFEVKSEWISTCAGIFKKYLFNKYEFPNQFITYSNNEYVMFSYNLFKNNEGEMLYTSKAKYKDIQTSFGRINRIQLMYQIETYDLYIFINLFEFNIRNLFIYFKSRVGHLIYYVIRLIFNKNSSIKFYFHSVFSIFYPLINISSIIRNDLSFFERDFPIK